MSFNQSRSDKSEAQYRRSTRATNIDQQRSSSSSYVKSTPGGPPPPQPSAAAQNRSIKKSSNVQPQTQVYVPASTASDASAGKHDTKTHSHPQQQSHGLPAAVPKSDASRIAQTYKSSNTNAPKAPTPASNNVAAPKAPTPVSSNVTVPKAHVKTPGDVTSSSFKVQFGSFSPGFVNNIQIPRTSSAPPNLDEQKREHAKKELAKSVHVTQDPSRKPQVQVKEALAIDKPRAVAVDQPHAVAVDKPHAISADQPRTMAVDKPCAVAAAVDKPQTVAVAVDQPRGVAVDKPRGVAVDKPRAVVDTEVPKDKTFTQVTSTPAVAQPPKPPAFAVPKSSGPMQFHQPQVPVKFGVPTSQIQSQGITSSMHLPPASPLQMRSAAQIQQPMFIPALQPIPVQSQGLIHQGQGISYATQTPQLGSLGTGIASYVPPLGTSRKPPVRITDPRTNQELQLDNQKDASAGTTLRSHVGAPSQGFPFPAFTPTTFPFYPHSYSQTSLSFPHPPLPGSLAPKMNYPSVSGPQNLPFKTMSPVNSFHIKQPAMTSRIGEHQGMDQLHLFPTKPSVPVRVSSPPRTVRAADDGSQLSSADTVPSDASKRKTKPSGICSMPDHQVENGARYEAIAKQIKSENEGPESKSSPTETAHCADSLVSSPKPDISEEGGYETSKQSYLKDRIGQESSATSVLPSNVPKGDASPVAINGVPVIDEYPPDSTVLKKESSGEDDSNSNKVADHGAADIPSPTSGVDETVRVSDSLPESKHGDSFRDSELKSISAVEEQQEKKLPCEEHVKDSSVGPEVVNGLKNIEEKPETHASRVHVLESKKEDSREPITLTVGPGQSIASGSVDPQDKDDTKNDQKQVRSQQGLGGGSELPTEKAVPVSKEKTGEVSRSRSSASKLRKRRKEVLQKADAAGASSDLYMAYKGPEEKKEVVTCSEVVEVSYESLVTTESSVSVLLPKAPIHEKPELDDWEDAAEAGTSDKTQQVAEDHTMKEDDAERESSVRKFSRDFLLKFSEQCRELPDTFNLTPDITDTLMSPGVSRLGDRSGTGSRHDRRGGGMVEDDRWNKGSASFGAGRDAAHLSFRPGQGGAFGVSKSARFPLHLGAAPLTGSMQQVSSHGDVLRNSSDSDRWSRATGLSQKGMSASSHISIQMHRAEKKYEIGKVTDEEQAKQRQLKSILNKLTPQNFEKLFDQVKAVNIDNYITLTGVISQIFDKALMEPTFCEMYADFCVHLAGELPDFFQDDEKVTFRRLLLNMCQEEFERGEREQEEADKDEEEEGEVVKASEEERAEKKSKARRRMLGNIRLIGELYKKRMLTDRIMHECIQKLLGGQTVIPDEEDIEALCKLMSTIGEMIDHPRAKELMDAYFDRMEKLSANTKLSSRVRFMLRDSIDLRKNRWQQRRKVEGPKKIEEVHRDAVQERQHGGRASRGLSTSFSSRRAPADFGSKTQATGSFRQTHVQSRTNGTQDARFEDRQIFEAKLPAPLAQKNLTDDSISLGPQGGLARGMSSRGLPSTDSSLLQNEYRKVTAGSNGYGSTIERSSSGLKSLGTRASSDQIPAGAASDQLGGHDGHSRFNSRSLLAPERGHDRGGAPQSMKEAGFAHDGLSTKEDDDHLREKSLTAIKEYYSAKDEKEVAVCIQELGAPSLHPSMVSLWVTDSFERKDKERKLLGKLLVDLTNPRLDILTPSQIAEGFESVLSVLEDTIPDAPKAPEFLGGLFAEAVMADVLPLKEIGRLLHKGGEEPGRLLEVGLASDVLGCTLGAIGVEKGEDAVSEICSASKTVLKGFQNRGSNRSKILDKYI